MSIVIPGVGLPPSPKRPTPEGFDKPPPKKAKTEDGESSKGVAEASKVKADKSEPIDGESQTIGEQPCKKPIAGESQTTEKQPCKSDPIDGESQTTDEQPSKSEPIDGESQATGEVHLKEPNTESQTTVEEAKPKELPTGYLMNVNGSLVEAHHGTPFREVVDLPITVLKGISAQQARVLGREFNVRTVRELANWKFFQIARSMHILSGAEEVGGRLETSLQNVNDAVDKKFEKRLITDIMKQKAEVLQGVGKYLQKELSKKVGITTMKELADFQPAIYATALVVLADYETVGFESKTLTDDSRPVSTFRPVVG